VRPKRPRGRVPSETLTLAANPWNERRYSVRAPVIQPGAGEFCVFAGGLSPARTPAIVAPTNPETPPPFGGAVAAQALAGSCPNGAYPVETEAHGLRVIGGESFRLCGLFGCTRHLPCRRMGWDALRSIPDALRHGIASSVTALRLHATADRTVIL
jgi:hypothetical protein